MGWMCISPFRPISKTGQNLTLGSASVPSAAVSAQTYAVQLSSSGNCHVAIGPAPVATATDMLVKATDPPLVVKVAPGEKIAVIQDGSSTGTLNLVELTH